MIVWTLFLLRKNHLYFPYEHAKRYTFLNQNSGLHFNFNEQLVEISASYLKSLLFWKNDRNTILQLQSPENGPFTE